MSIASSAGTLAGEVSSNLCDLNLSQRINIATRQYYTILNQLILTRLPLALPPHASTAEFYALGLSSLAPIYLTFESAWQHAVESESTSELPLETAVLLSTLIHLFIPELLRTNRLRRDLSSLLGLSVAQIDVRLAQPSGFATREFVRHIDESISSKPHVIIAYAWVMYMALFNGGRWIRGQLLEARDSSWELDQTASVISYAQSMTASSEMTNEYDDDDSETSIPESSERGLEFWHFSGHHDGDNFKNQFQARLVDVDGMLTTEQREDVLQEAQIIFQNLAAIVDDLDEVVAARNRAVQRAEQVPGTFAKFFSHRLLLMVLAELMYGLLFWMATWDWPGIVTAARFRSWTVVGASKTA